MTRRQSAVLCLGVRTANAVRRHAELNGCEPHEVDSARVRALVQEVSQPECSPDQAAFCDDVDRRGLWRRLEGDVMRFAAGHLGIRRDWWE